MLGGAPAEAFAVDLEPCGMRGDFLKDEMIVDGLLELRVLRESLCGFVIVADSLLLDYNRSVRCRLSLRKIKRETHAPLPPTTTP